MEFRMRLAIFRSLTVSMQYVSSPTWECRWSDAFVHLPYSLRFGTVLAVLQLPLVQG